MFLQLFQYWFAVERNKLLTANLCGRQDTKNISLFVTGKRNEMKSLKTPLLTEIQCKIGHFLQINTLDSLCTV